MVGFAAGLIGGWVKSSVTPGMLAAVSAASIIGIVGINQSALHAADYVQLGMNIVLATLMSFVGSIASIKIREHLGRSRK
ncbi:MAG: hypothetical protein ABS49_01690 [Erythrobacter sp. SCN 62-14]|nr:MAG: hypothetical protein ABS49_01690 [Erythrobacter sp. SCN 62-14]